MGSTEPGSFGELLRRSRMAAGLTQEELAERAGLSARGIQDLERGLRRSPHPDTVRRLWAALGLSDTRRPVEPAEIRALRAGMDAAVAGERALTTPAATRRMQVDAGPMESGDGQPLANNLPAPISSFVGREEDMAGVIRALEAARLVTLVGTGGCGKTRLAVEVGTRTLSEYAHGVWFVELAPLTDPELVPAAILEALRRREVAGQTHLAVLENYLRSKQALLVLDNCEHLIESSAQLAYAVLRACPRLRILATSREPLRITGERLCRLSMLPVPPETITLAPRDLAAAYAAVQLFVDRARLVRPEFELNDSSAPAVARICRRLDGHPLALELAAARLRTLSPEQIATRLEDRFRLLVGGGRAVAPRQRTLVATLDWSYGLLSPDEQALMRRLSVFAGGWTLEAAEKVAEYAGVAEVLELLTGLVDKSLAQVAASADPDEPRYWLHEMVRQYAAERHSAAGEWRTPEPITSLGRSAGQKARFRA
jgi:predicted ATPase/transcriptional regulator with XRE-family HTH domain